MSENLTVKAYERRVTPLERIFLRSPYSIVTVIARIRGEVSEGMLRDAVSKVQRRHANLRVRIVEHSAGDPWFTSEGAQGIPVEVVPRASDDHWVEVYHEACRVPFEFEKRPAIRFILVQSSTVSELIVLCHHIICDGMSLAYLARDLMVHLGDPAREVEVLPDPVLFHQDSMPEEVSLNPVARFFMNRINVKWEAAKVFFDQEDYRDLNHAYWENFSHRMLTVELSEEQTTALVERCREEAVTVTSALTAAFAGAQYVVQGEKPYQPRIAVAGSVRDRLQIPAGEAVGFYAGGVSLKWKYSRKVSFWENARQLHRRLQSLYADKNLFRETVVWCYLEPGIMESLSFKMVGGLVPPSAARYEKLHAFSEREDVILSMLKREGMDSLDGVILGTAVTNLTRMDFPRTYGVLELDRLFMNPGGAYPLALVHLVLGAVTCSGKLSLVVEYAEGTVDTQTMQAIVDRAMEYLTGG